MRAGTVRLSRPRQQRIFGNYKPLETSHEQAWLIMYSSRVPMAADGYTQNITTEDWNRLIAIREAAVPSVANRKKDYKPPANAYGYARIGKPIEDEKKPDTNTPPSAPAPAPVAKGVKAAVQAVKNAAMSIFAADDYDYVPPRSGDKDALAPYNDYWARRFEELNNG